MINDCGSAMKTESDKWQLMQSIVNQCAVQLPSNTFLTLQQFNTLRKKRLLIDNLLVFLTQYIGLKLSTFGLAPSPLWLATGFSCAYLFLRGTSVLPGIWLGSLFGFYFEKIGLRLSFECASVFTVQALLLLKFSYRYLSPILICTNQRTFVNYILFTAILTALISLIFTGICYPLIPPNHSFFQCWTKYWLANLNAIIILSSAMISWDAYATSVQAIKQEKTIYMVFSTFLVLNIIFCFNHTLVSTTCLAFTIMLMTIFVSMRFGWCGAIVAAFLSGVVLSFAGFLDAAVFSTYPAALSLFLVQLFLCINAIIGLSVAIMNTHVEAR